MNPLHLIWIIPASLLVGFFLGVYAMCLLRIASINDVDDDVEGEDRV